MVTIEVEEVREVDGENIVKRRVHKYPIVLDVGQRYIGIEQGGKYRVFEQGTVRSLVNENGHVSTSSTEIEELGIEALNVFADEYAIIHGDLTDVSDEGK